MIEILKSRWHQGYRTMRYPAGEPPELPRQFAGRPVIKAAACAADCQACVEVCPTDAIHIDEGRQQVRIDTGRCIFCRACTQACGTQAITFSREYRLAAASRADLEVSAEQREIPAVFNEQVQRVFGRSLKLRQVSAGGCNACEADTNVLNTLAWDLGRFGIQFVASPRHADGLLVTGPVTENMRTAVLKTYEAVPAPRIVIAVGACAISGGLYRDHPETHNGVDTLLPVDVYIPGCPPHPLTILEGLLAFLRPMR